MSLSKLRNALLYNPGSVFSNVGALLLWEKQVQSRYALTPIDMKQQVNISTEFLRLNPMGKVPVLIHDGQAIPDSFAIAQFLDKQDELQSHDDKVVAMVERWRNVRVVALWMGKKQPHDDTTQLADQLARQRQQVVDYQQQGMCYATRLAAHDDRAHILLDHAAYLHHRDTWHRLLDDADRVLANQPYLVHHQFTLADVYATSFLFWYLQKVGGGLFTGRRYLEHYYYRQLDRTSVRNAFNIN
ncbi:hypothetical protein BC941DRAFT_419977 [Chlamydoabsidia padenii]|nr:hypothetical protein BC941DRAFT_419977 [Chlamydoabsidia padenii]